MLANISNNYQSYNGLLLLLLLLLLLSRLVVSDSMRPHRQHPTRLPHPWDSPGKNIGVGCHFLLQCMQVKSQSEVAQSCPTLHDPMDCSMLGFPVFHHLPELAHTHVHGVSDAIQLSHLLSFPSPAFNLSQHQGLF